jgi:hypothetical protein
MLRDRVISGLGRLKQIPYVSFHIDWGGRSHRSLHRLHRHNEARSGSREKGEVVSIESDSLTIKLTLRTEMG